MVWPTAGPRLRKLAGFAISGPPVPPGVSLAGGRVADLASTKKGGRMASIETPRELFVHKLGAALTMEETILEMLENLQEEASDPKLRRDLQQHHRETQQHVSNLQQIFRALGEEPEKQSCPAIDGLEKEGKQMIKEVDESLVDSVILGG